MKFAGCITTRNDVNRLDGCLQAIWDSSFKPNLVIVSDDSEDVKTQRKNRYVVSQYPGTKYVLGPRRGVNANRNNAVKLVPKEIDLVAFIDDDVWLDKDFIENAFHRYKRMSRAQRNKTFITGISYTKFGHASVPTKLSFRGYYQPTNSSPECVHIHSAVFPRAFFNEVQWEENIFFGQGDAILCLRALRRGYRIIYCPELKALNTRPEGGTLATVCEGKLTDYDIYQISARLYIGIQRYKYLFPNPIKLTFFLFAYFSHAHLYLWRNHALKAWPLIFQRSRFKQLLLSR